MNCAAMNARQTVVRSEEELGNNARALDALATRAICEQKRFTYYKKPQDIAEHHQKHVLAVNDHL